MKVAAAETKTIKSSTSFKTWWFIGLILILTMIELRGLSHVNQGILLAPQSSDVFSSIFHVLGGHRIVLPTWMTQPLLVFFTLLPSLLLLIWFLCLRTLLPGSPLQKLLVAFLLWGIFFTHARPGSNTSFIASLVFSTLVLAPLLVNLSPLSLWGLATLGVCLALSFPSLSLVVLWISLCCLSIQFIEFLFEHKGEIRRRYRMSPLQASLLIFGTCALFTWIYKHTHVAAFQLSQAGPSSFWYLSIIISSLCILLAWRHPWHSGRWMGMASLSHGLFFSSAFELPSTLLLGWILIHLFFEIRIPRFEHWNSWLRPLAIASALIAAPLLPFISRSPSAHSQNFDPAWIRLAGELQSHQALDRSFLVVGNGLPFLSHFVPRHLVREDGLLVEISDENLFKYLDQKRVNSILVERSFFKEFWRLWLERDLPAERANQSVISRLVQYDGKAIQTPTLKLAEIRGFTVRPLESTPSFVWIDRTDLKK